MLYTGLRRLEIVLAHWQYHAWCGVMRGNLSHTRTREVLENNTRLKKKARQWQSLPLLLTHTWTQEFSIVKAQNSWQGSQCSGVLFLFPQSQALVGRSVQCLSKRQSLLGKTAESSLTGDRRGGHVRDSLLFILSFRV